MLNTTITLADILEVEFGTGSSKNKFVIEGPFAAGVPAEGNLIASAAEKFAQHFGICVAPFTVKLTKNVPSGAGLGGGSSDAAAMLRVLLKEYAEPIAGWLRKSPNRPQLFDEMQKIAIQLGADVPFFLKGGLAHVGGIGEVISPLSAVNESPLFLCVPSQGISSRDFYAFLRTKYPSLPRKFDETARELAKQSSEGLSNGNLFSLMRNDFEGLPGARKL
jgi:4-diphosphocytidyl-2-C-methyl-D-erythritol kinase